MTTQRKPKSTESADSDCFIERMGLALEAEMMPRIAGRILGLLLLEGGPLGFEAMSARLKVSRGSVSTNTRMLVEKGMIERVSLPGDRRDYFQIGESPGESMLLKASERLRATFRVVTEARISLADVKPDAAPRLARMARFYATVLRAIETAIDELRDEAGDR